MKYMKKQTRNIKIKDKKGKTKTKKVVGWVVNFGKVMYWLEGDRKPTYREIMKLEGN